MLARSARQASLSAGANADAETPAPKIKTDSESEARAPDVRPLLARLWPVVAPRFAVAAAAAPAAGEVGERRPMPQDVVRVAVVTHAEWRVRPVSGA